MPILIQFKKRGIGLHTETFETEADAVTWLTKNDGAYGRDLSAVTVLRATEVDVSTLITKHEQKPRPSLTWSDDLINRRVVYSDLYLSERPALLEHYSKKSGTIREVHLYDAAGSRTVDYDQYGVTILDVQWDGYPVTDTNGVNLLNLAFEAD